MIYLMRSVLPLTRLPRLSIVPLLSPEIRSATLDRSSPNPFYEIPRVSRNPGDGGEDAKG
jgi:hypothetical protein